ncbi:unnamed protein product [Closterium sp. NIES-54]
MMRKSQVRPPPLTCPLSLSSVPFPSPAILPAPLSPPASPPTLLLPAGLGGRLWALRQLAASTIAPLPSALPSPRPSSRGLRRAHSAAPPGGAAGGRGRAPLMGGALRLVQPHAPSPLGKPPRTLPCAAPLSSPLSQAALH